MTELSNAPRLTPQDITARITDTGHDLPDMPAANGNYDTWTVDAGLFRTSGQVSRLGTSIIEGPVPSHADLSQSRHAAEIAVMRCLALLKEASDGFRTFDRIVSLRGFISSNQGFADQSKVLDAASDLLVAVFGDQGRHIRSALGVASLPGNGLIELELEARLSE